MKSQEYLSGGKTYRRLLSYLSPLKFIFVITILGMVLLAFIEMNLARIMGPITKAGFLDRDSEAVIKVMIELGILFFVRGFAGLFVIYLTAKISRSIIHALRQQIFNKLLNLPSKTYDVSPTGELISMMSYNTEQVADSTTSVLTTLFKDGLTIIFLIGLMIYINPTISLLFLVVVPLLAMIMSAVSKRFRLVSHRIQNTMSDSTQVIEEAIDGHKVIKVFGGHEHELNRFTLSNDQNKNQNIKLGLTKGLMEPLVQIIAAVFLLSLIYISVFDQGIGADEFLQLISAILLVFPALKRITNVNVSLQRGIAAAQSIFYLLDSESEVDKGTFTAPHVDGKIEYENVSFNYESRKNVLNNISLNINAGETVAFVGQSGSGKSTLVNLLPRLYTGFEGKIKLDGHAVNDYELSNLRKHISYVGQEVTLFNDTIANNIAYGNMDTVSREQIIQAARDANCESFILEMDGGFDAMIGEDGTRLSGGQRQRLAIARAILKDSPILILDEATSALDSESEEKIQIALERLMQNRTTLVIAHRLSTIENADKIVVMQDGEIIEQGEHKSLIKQKGQYASLHKLQFNVEADTSDIVPVASVAKSSGSDVVEYHRRGHNYLSDSQGTNIFERMWYGAHPLAMFMVPATLVYGSLVFVRKQLYNLGLFKRFKPEVPVIIIGNLTVGGTGKTPLVIWVAKLLTKLGWHVGIISRGYKGKSETWPLIVNANTNPELSGDEPVIIAAATKCPVSVGANRQESVELLTEEYGCNIIISDDGLQHYALDRDIEVLVTDGSRGFGNGLLLPAGPMREPRSRIKQCDFIVSNGATLPNAYSMYMQGDTIFDLEDNKSMKLKALSGKTVHGVAAIGNPDRFFDLLRLHNINVIEHAMVDHSEFTKADILFDDGYPVIMTEKDAVKCLQFSSEVKGEEIYYLPVTAQMSDEFEEAFKAKVSEFEKQEQES